MSFTIIPVNEIQGYLNDSPTTEKVFASGRARCRICGEKITKGKQEIKFFFSNADGSYNSWMSIEGHVHDECAGHPKVEYDYIKEN